MKTKTFQFLKYIGLFVAALAILYTFIWFKTVHKLETKIVAEISRLNKEGFNIRYNNIHCSGFPWRLQISFDNVKAQLPAPFNFSINLRGPLIAHTSVFKAHHFYLQIDDPFTLNATDQDDSELAYLNVGHLKLHVPYNQQEGFELFLTDVSHVSHQVATATIKAHRINAKQDSYQVSLQYDNLTLHHSDLIKLLDLSNIQQLNCQITIQYLDKEMTKLTTLQSLIQSLYDHESLITLDQLNLSCDHFKLGLTGTIAFDEQLQPIIALGSEITNIDYFLKLLVTHKLIHKSLRPLIASALHSLAEPKADNAQETETVHKIPITLQNQELSIMNFTLAKFPLIQWQDL